MERTPGSEFGLVLLLLAVLPDCARGTPCAWGRGGSMMCKQESSGRTSASLEFGLDGQIFLLFDSTKKSWVEMHPQSGPLRKALDGDRKLLVTISLEDCVNGLQQVSETQGEVLDTKAAPITVPAPATTTPTIASASPTKTTDRLETWAIIVIVPVIVTVLIIVSIIGYRYRKRSKKMLLKCCWECGLVQKVSQLFGCPSTSNCSPVDLQELLSFQQMQSLAEGGEDTADAMFVSRSP